MTDEAKPTPPQAPAPAAKAEPAPLEMGKFGKVLQSNGVPSKRLPDSCGVETVEIDAKDLLKATKALRDDKEAKLNLLNCLSGVDNLETFDSVYHLWSYENINEFVMKVAIPKTQVAEGKLPDVPSLVSVWNAANWHERESYDLVGINYVGHPYLRRILNPWDWEGHPLRRDYKQPVDALNDKNPHSFR